MLELTALRGALESTDRARGSAPSVSTGSRSGSNFPVELSLSAACEKSEIFVLAIIRDISERKRNENALHQALEKSRVASQAKSEFLTNMTHELFTPMNSILGMTELALASELNQEQKQYLDIIKFSGDSLLYMLHSILDYSKIESGKMPLDNTEFSLQALLEETIGSFAVEVLRKGIILATKISPAVPREISADFSKIKQVLEILISNAVKFTDTGEIVLSIERADKVEKSLFFEVRDTGIGMSAAETETIFRVFTQIDGSYTRKFGGTGLGLALAQRVVELLGGRIWAESEAGVGSSFFFTIPYESDRAFGPGDDTGQDSSCTGRGPSAPHDEENLSPSVYSPGMAELMAKLRIALKEGHYAEGERYAGLVKREAEKTAGDRLKTLAFKIVLALRKDDIGEAERAYGLAEREFEIHNNWRNFDEDVDR